MEGKYKSIKWYEDRLNESQHFQALILNFHRVYKDDMSKNLVDNYIKYFGITRLMEGKIGE